MSAGRRPADHPATHKTFVASTQPATLDNPLVNEYPSDGTLAPLNDAMTQASPQHAPANWFFDQWESLGASMPLTSVDFSFETIFDDVIHSEWPSDGNLTLPAGVDLFSSEILGLLAGVNSPPPDTPDGDVEAGWLGGDTLAPLDAVDFRSRGGSNLDVATDIRLLSAEIPTLSTNAGSS